MKMALYAPKAKYNVEAIQLNSHNINTAYNWILETIAQVNNSNLLEITYNNSHIFLRDINHSIHIATFDDFIIKTKQNHFSVCKKTKFNNNFERV